MSAAIEWDHKDEWRLRGRDFMVTVSRHAVKPSGYWEGPHRWCVYAFIYPKHPHFAAFDGPDMWQGATASLPGHSYCSHLSYPTFDGKIGSVKVGFDYNHDGDDRFTQYATKEDAYQVFNDAAELFHWLEAKAAQEVTA